MKKSLPGLAVTVLLCGMSVASQAATMTLSTWTFGNGNTVNTSGPHFGGQAGGFTGTLSGAGSPFHGSIDAYCVELGQYFQWSTDHDNYNVVAAGSYFSNAKATTLGKLLSYANPLVDTAAESTSLQLAIWNTVYDSDNTLSGGLFSDISAFAAQANAFLIGAAGTDNTLDLYVLQSKTNDPQGSTGHQDQLIWKKRIPPQDVPEPASLALALVALGGLGIGSRHRRSR